MTVTVILPVLGRPHRVPTLLQSLRDSQHRVPLEPLFMVSPGDRQQLRMIQKWGAPHIVVGWQPDRGDYAMKINMACRETDTEWVLAGADDLDFKHGWADEAIRVSEQSGKRFVATNDMGNPLVRRGKHATHPLVHRSYLPLAVTDSPGDLYYEGYHHECVDVEATGTAMAYGEFVFAPRAVVEHCHYLWRKSRFDATYEKGRSHGREDRELCARRTHLWANLQHT